MLEIEKIKNFIEKHNHELCFEVYNSGGFANNVTCEIDYLKALEIYNSNNL